MDWKKLTGTDGNPIFVNLEMVTHIQRQGDRSLIMLAGRGPDQIATIAVREMPEDILSIAAR